MDDISYPIVDFYIADERQVVGVMKIEAAALRSEWEQQHPDLRLRDPDFERDLVRGFWIARYRIIRNAQADAYSARFGDSA